MPDVEQRLKALEKRARTDRERWQMLDAQTKAFALIFQAIGAPICTANASAWPRTMGRLSLATMPPCSVSSTAAEHAASAVSMASTRIIAHSRPAAES
jgi:hypothetical protein